MMQGRAAPRGRNQGDERSIPHTAPATRGGKVSRDFCATLDPAVLPFGVWPVRHIDHLARERVRGVAAIVEFSCPDEEVADRFAIRRRDLHRRVACREPTLRSQSQTGPVGDAT